MLPLFVYSNMPVTIKQGVLSSLHQLETLGDSVLYYMGGMP